MAIAFSLPFLDVGVLTGHLASFWKLRKNWIQHYTLDSELLPALAKEQFATLTAHFVRQKGERVDQGRLLHEFHPMFDCYIRLCTVGCSSPSCEHLNIFCQLLKHLIIKLNTTSKLPYMFTQQCEKIVSEYLNV